MILVFIAGDAEERILLLAKTRSINFNELVIQLLELALDAEERYEVHKTNNPGEP